MLVINVKFSCTIFFFPFGSGVLSLQMGIPIYCSAVINSGSNIEQNYITSLNKNYFSLIFEMLAKQK